MTVLQNVDYILIKAGYDDNQDTVRFGVPCSVLFCSSAVLDPRVGHTVDLLPPFILWCDHSMEWMSNDCGLLDAPRLGRYETVCRLGLLGWISITQHLKI